MASVNLYLNKRIVKATEVTYNDLVDLYDQFCRMYGRVPITSECTAKNNLPQSRIIKRVLKERGITYKDFIAQFGKMSHVRAAISDYNEFVEKYKMFSQQAGRPLTSGELTDSKYNLPQAKWFVRYCPDKTVKSYRDFVTWCGFNPCKKVWTKEEVSNALRQFESDNNRNITTEDITTPNIGFSMIVVNRLFGTIENARAECNLLPLIPRHGDPDTHYIDMFTEVVLDYKQKTGRPYISWDEIESGKYGSRTYGHKCYTMHFLRAGIDLFTYVKSLGCLMNQNSYSNSYIFDNGELVRSSMEYDFTTYLNECGFTYKIDYMRDVRYRTFSGATGKIDCDYVIDVNGLPVYVEIAGVLDSSYNGKWESIDIDDPHHVLYRDNLLKKKDVLESIGAEYYFLFKDDIRNSSYKNLIDKLAARRSA